MVARTAVSLSSMEPFIPPELQAFSSRIADFVRAPLDYPTWQVLNDWYRAPTWDGAAAARINAMNIPVAPQVSQFSDPRPDMLLYALGDLESFDPLFRSRLDDFVSGEDHLCVHSPRAFPVWVTYTNQALAQRLWFWQNPSRLRNLGTSLGSILRLFRGRWNQPLWLR